MFKIFGFTLIELIVTMTIVSILAFFGFSGYMDSLRVNRRKDAVVSLKKAMLIVNSAIAVADTVAPVCATIGTQDYAYDETNQNCKSEGGFYFINYKRDGFTVTNTSIINNLINNEVVWLRATATSTQIYDNKNGLDCTKIFLTSFGNVYPSECAS